MSNPLPASAVDKDVNEQIEAVVDLLRARGGRITPARRLLLHCLFEANDHLTAEDVARQVQEKAPDVHLSTIYRNLDELEQLGVITHAHLGHGGATYHLTTRSHGHLVCQDCNRTFETTDALFSALSNDAFDQFGFVIDPHHFAVLGRCKDCARSNSASESHDDHSASHKGDHHHD